MIRIDATCHNIGIIVTVMGVFFMTDMIVVELF